MDRIDFLKYNQFPVSSETYSMLQAMIQFVAKLASLAGTNYILDGCVTNGQSVSAGTVVIAGEILPFAGGAQSTYVVISETKTSVQAYDETYSDVYINRRVIFGTGTGQIAWANFQSFSSLLTLAASISSLQTNFATHVANHSVAWASVTGKPNSFTPSAHTQDWDTITEKPNSYAPSAHNQAWGTITEKPISIVYCGQFNAAGTVITKISGAIDVAVQRTNVGVYTLTHNIGHLNYIVLGVSCEDPNTQTVSVRSMNNVTENWCVIHTSDDSSHFDAQTRFIIITF